MKNASSIENASGGVNSPSWRTKIDWLSFSTPSLSYAFTEQDHDNASISILSHLLSLALGCQGAFSELDACGQHGKGRTFHARSVHFAVGITVYYGGVHAPPLVEISGAGCDWLCKHVSVAAIASRNADTVSRIDFAADLHCTASPSEFVNAGLSARHTTRTSHKSDTGDTEYIGSPHSDRRARVYRYFPPHPRSEYLRIEVVLRRELAKQAASRLDNETTAQLWRAAADPYDFKHPHWRVTEKNNEALKTMRNEKTTAARLRWLIKVCVPALRDAIAEGLVSPDVLSPTQGDTSGL